MAIAGSFREAEYRPYFFWSQFGVRNLWRLLNFWEHGKISKKLGTADSTGFLGTIIFHVARLGFLAFLDRGQKVKFWGV